MINLIEQMRYPVSENQYNSEVHFNLKQVKKVIPKICLKKITFLQPQYDFFMNRETTFLGFIGGIGSGKTFTLIRTCLDHMRTEAGTGTIGFLGANTHKQLHQVLLKELWNALNELGMRANIHYVFNRKPPAGWGIRSAFENHEGILTIRYWGQVVCQSLTNFDAIRGAEFGWIGIDEARDVPPMAWGMLLGRFRCKKAKKRIARLSTTPNGFDWLWEYLEENKTLKNISDKERLIIRMSTFENPFLPDSFLLSLLQSYSPQQIRQELLGHFVNITAGQVYVSFNRYKNISSNIYYSPELPLVISFDFNRTPYCVTISQTDNKIVNVLDEITMEQATTYEVANRIVERWGKIHNKKEVQIYGDPMGQHKLSTISHRTDYGIVKEVLSEIFDVHMFIKRRAPGILDRVNAMNAMLCNGKGERRLMIHPNCRYLMRDLEQVTWHPTQKGQLNKTGEQNKMLTHMSDGLGYFICSKFPAYVATARRLSF